jgi:hypothetical protein
VKEVPKQFNQTNPAIQAADATWWMRLVAESLRVYTNATIGKEDTQADMETKAIAASRLAAIGRLMATHFDTAISSLVDVPEKCPGVAEAVTASYKAIIDAYQKHFDSQESLTKKGMS